MMFLIKKLQMEEKSEIQANARNIEITVLI